MSSLRLVFLSLIHYGRNNLAVGFGVAVATAVLTGALLVGDSMRGSLRALTLDRLGRIDQALVAERFFRETLSDQLAAAAEFPRCFSQSAPAILLSASIQSARGEPPRRANRVNLIGCDDRFSQLGPSGPGQLVGGSGITINQALADALGIAEPGEEALLRLPEAASIPSDSPLGNKEETIRRARVTVSRIIPNEGLGRFSLRASQSVPKNAFVPLGWLQERLDQPGRANVIFIAGRDDSASPAEVDALLPGWLRPAAEDLGLSIAVAGEGYFNITSDRMMIDAAAEQELLRVVGDRAVQPALTYLANAIVLEDREIPYSTVTAIDFAPNRPFGPFLDPSGQPVALLGEGEIALNAWAAEDLGAKPGDTIRLRYFEPESPDGQVRETSAEFRLAAVVALEGAAADPDFTPEVRGVTDVPSIGQWDAPFPFDARKIRKKDETYWDEHRATPKAFVSLATGRRLWGSRFGQTTNLRVEPRGGEPVEAFAGRFEPSPAAFGLRFQPVKRMGLAAAEGTTPFHVLFLLFSFFVIAAALMLVVLLFRLGIEQRAESIGILRAVGLDRGRIIRLLAAEGLAVAALAAAAGVGLGLGYAALMLAGLKNWWLAAVVTPFLQLHAAPASLAIGYGCGLAVCFATIFWTLWRARRTSASRLLGGELADQYVRPGHQAAWAGWLPPALVAAAVAIGLSARSLSEDARAGAFFAAGAAVLAAGLLWVRRRLRHQATGPAVAVGRGGLLRLALRGAARNPARSTLSIGLIASTSFLIVATSAFHLDLARRAPRLDSGNGGFALIAESDQPILHDPNTDDGRFALAFSEEDSRLLQSSRTFGLRVKSGDDASCLNLYQPRQPRMLGVPEDFRRRGGFAWTASAARTPEEEANPWLLLEQPAEPDADGTPCVPVVLDNNTAIYALHLYGGVGETYDIADDRGRTLRLRIVGLLKNSIFQGDLILAEQRLLEHFPLVSGRRFFLIECDLQKAGDVAAAWNRTLGDFGLGTETTGERLAGFAAVQNTYLSAFQSLGALGLLLGTFGLAAVQLRNVLERRRELALLRAAGFRRAALGWMVLVENALLLAAGLACGLLAAALAVLPHLLAGAAAAPIRSLAAMLLVILLVGLLASLLAVRATLRAPLVAALRGE